MRKTRARARALENIGAGAGESRGADEQGEQQKHQIGVVHAQNHLLSHYVADYQHDRNREPDRRQHRTKENVHRALQPVRQGRARSADRLRRRDERGDRDAAERCGRMERADRIGDRGCELLGEVNHRRHIGHEHDYMVCDGMRRGRVIIDRRRHLPT